VSDWPVSWDEHRRAQLREIARLPVQERVRWFEEARELARASGALERSCRVREQQIQRRWAGED
jgi:hypothetical protein